MNPFFTGFCGCLLTVFTPNSFSSMDSAYQSDFYTWFSCLHIGLYGHLRYQDISTLGQQKWLVRDLQPSWLAVAAQPGNYRASQMALETSSYRAELRLYCRELITKLRRPPTSVHPPENDGPWFMKSSMLTDVLRLLVTDTGAHAVESHFFYSPIHRRAQLMQGIWFKPTSAWI